MLVLPMGTENLLGKYLRQSIDPAAVLDVVENGVIIDLDLGWANGHPFLLMISAGFDAEVIRALHETRRGNISRATYILPILSVIKRYAFRPMRIYWDSADVEGPETTLCRWLFGFNLPLYAFGLPIASNADGTDCLLDVCAFERGSIWNIFRYLWHVARKVHHNLPDAVVRQTQHFRIESVGDTPIAFQLDGDFGGMLPVEVKVVPRQLRLLVHRETAKRIGFTLSNLSANKT
jgi:diacylglycerol kinase family enzyme